MRRLWIVAALGLAVLLAGCHHAKVTNPIANVNSKQPDKVLFDRSMEAMKKGKYDVARLTLQTLINTYPDSEFVARAKLAVGDSWYAEGGTASLQQAEIEYKDFITFFPNMPEAAEAQLKVAMIHYRQMEKADRDYTHAKRAEEELRQLMQQFPDSKLLPEAKERLREVQEVLAEREYRIGHFYYMRESWAAAIARLKSVTDAYPLYSRSDEALMLLGSAYEKQVDAMRAAKVLEIYKGRLIADFTKHAAEAYDRVITRYPVGGEADKARERLQALHQPVPQPTPEAIAQNKAEVDSRGEAGKFERVMLNFKRHPDFAPTVRVGEPIMTSPPETSATEIVQQAQKALMETALAAAGAPNNAGATTNGNNAVAPATGSSTGSTVEIVGGKGVPPPGEVAPRSEQPAANVGAPPAAPAPDNSGIEDLAAKPGNAAPPNPQPATQPTVQPTAQPSASPDAGNTRPAAAPPVQPGPTVPPQAPPQVNEAAQADQAQAASNEPAAKDSSSAKGKKKKNKKKPAAQQQPAPQE